MSTIFIRDPMPISLIGHVTPINFEPIGTSIYYSHRPNTIGIGNGVDVGGEQWLPVGDNGGAGMTLTYTSSNPAVMAVVGSKVDSDGNYFVLVQGVSYGQADIIGTDQTGSTGDSGNFWDSPPGVQVSNANSNEIEGATYSAGDMPGFVFNIAYPSVTAGKKIGGKKIGIAPSKLARGGSDVMLKHS